ncbi:MAG TPA: SPASM domain-containing protein [Candidatus Hydrogenedens sp.]|nr:SPASM domain-containing protein [Candidatus Hydrogenedens sp.]HOL20602.1 SPASM domain-containing protein [Candidatus Hydrogenedens sp.]HPP57657.1 SPASM domain-containing protein [Candidatus Hydrogenedens sp.]
MSQRNRPPKNLDITLELVGFPKSLLKKVRRCSKLVETAPKDISYLWLRVSGAGIRSQRNNSQTCGLSLEDWLNVVDEAVAGGATWLVLTVDTPLDKMKEAIEICQWAQDTHNLKVGLFLCRQEITENEISTLKSLRKELTQIFVKKKVFEKFKKLKDLGFHLGIADPQEYGDKPNCEGASKLLYVDDTGTIYTCGLVAGKKEYRLGNIHERTFCEIVEDPNLPHRVEESIHKVNTGCDGCPSLLRRYLQNNT